MKHLLVERQTPDQLKIRLLFEEQVYKKRINILLTAFFCLNVIAGVYLLVLINGFNVVTAEQLASTVASHNSVLGEIVTWLVILLLTLGVLSLFSSIFAIPIEFYLFLKRTAIIVALELHPNRATMVKHNGIRTVAFYSIKPHDFLGLIIRSEKNRFTFGQKLHCISLIAKSDLTTKVPVEYLVTSFYPDENLIMITIQELKSLIFSFYEFSEEDILRRWSNMNPELAKRYNIPLKNIAISPTSKKADEHDPLNAG